MMHCHEKVTNDPLAYGWVAHESAEKTRVQIRNAYARVQLGKHAHVTECAMNDALSLGPNLGCTRRLGNCQLEIVYSQPDAQRVGVPTVNVAKHIKNIWSTLVVGVRMGICRRMCRARLYGSMMNVMTGRATRERMQTQ
jgi:hypothetical protein